MVSLVPSQTELLAWLGLAQQVVGITKFCVRPREWWRTKVRVGGTKQLHLDRIRDLQPDLIIGNKEENTREQVLALAESFPVWISEVSDLPTAYDMIETVGRLTHRQRATQLLNEQIQAAFAQLPLYPPLRAAYLIWRKPYMVAGGDTFIQAMLEQAGFINVFADRPRYPVTTTHELAARAPQLILLSSEPFPFNDKHRAELAKVCPSAVIMLVDGEAFSWYGSRLLTTPGYLHNLRNSILAHVSI
ncbi:MAG: cobalamin-binding protein [Bacteroidetes bacterium]|nr:MAG: cobalamin-binding protein [Bacteroidota bacterium]